MKKIRGKRERAASATKQYTSTIRSQERKVDLASPTGGGTGNLEADQNSQKGNGQIFKTPVGRKIATRTRRIKGEFKIK